jgi:Family of unknown function (DUF5946)
MNDLSEEYKKLAFYTLNLNDEGFIHQHIVDAFAAQTVNENTKPIQLTFALVGLYLYIEKQFTGRKVQQFHILMSKNKKKWPNWAIPQYKGEITITHTLATNEGQERNKMIAKWCKSVWDCFKINKVEIEKLVAIYH